MRIQWQFSKNSGVILGRLSHWPYVRFWHKSCRCRWPLRLKLMLRPFMLTVRVGGEYKPLDDLRAYLGFLGCSDIEKFLIGGDPGLSLKERIDNYNTEADRRIAVLFERDRRAERIGPRRDETPSASSRRIG